MHTIIAFRTPSNFNVLFTATQTPPRQPSGIVLASSAEGPGFIPQSRTASSIAQWYSTGFECGRSRVQSPVKDRLLDSLVVQCWLRVPEFPGSIPSQGPRHTKDVIKMVPVVALFSTEHSKGKILALSQELRQENKCNG